MKYLRSARFWAIVLVFVAAAVYSWNWYQDWNRYCRPRTTLKGPCLGYKVIPVKKLNEENKLEKGFDTVYYACNEIILQPGMDSYGDDLRRYLRCQGFVRSEKCACSDSIELWRHDPPDVDLIGVITDPPPPKSSGSGGGLSLNYKVGQEDFINNIPIVIQKEEKDKMISLQKPIDHSSQDSLFNVLIAITDSGVDTTNKSLLRINRYLVSPDPSHSCGLRTGNYGQSMLRRPFLQKEPVDDVGHSTFIGGILAGIASVNKQPTPNVRLSLLNIKTTVDNTGYLFDAVCGLYFGLEQGVKVFNVSWGYLDTASTEKSPRLIKTFLSDPRAKDSIVIVAALGNNGVLLNGNTRFWPACEAEYFDNVISVGASDASGYLATSSNFKTNYSTTPNRMTLVAPGVDIISLVPVYLHPRPTPTGFARGSGTSFAAPFVTRVVAFHLKNWPALAAKDSIIIHADTINQDLNGRFWTRFLRN